MPTPASYQAFINALVANNERGICPVCQHLWNECKCDVLPTQADTDERALAGRIRIGPRTLKIDGTEFPWLITEEGPTVRYVGGDYYEVTITLIAETVICDAD